MKLKALFSRAFFSYAWGHFRRGYGMGTSFLLGIFNALNIVIIGLKVFIPAFSFSTLLLIYAVSFIAIILISIGFDFLLLRLDFTQKEYLIGTRDNPAVSIPIGSKEILNYESAIAGFNRELNNYEVSKAICEALNLQDKIPILEQNIKSAQEYKAKLEDMLNKAVK
jgi:cell shape-determining protein MreC